MCLWWSGPLWWGAVVPNAPAVLTCGTLQRNWGQRRLNLRWGNRLWVLWKIINLNQEQPLTQKMKKERAGALWSHSIFPWVRDYNHGRRVGYHRTTWLYGLSRFFILAAMKIFKDSMALLADPAGLSSNFELIRTRVRRELHIFMIYSRMPIQGCRKTRENFKQNVGAKVHESNTRREERTWRTRRRTDLWKRGATAASWGG